MKKNRLMALTALLTLLGAPSSKAQEVKGDSKQPTSSQSASKDSKATDKTKEQVKNQGQNKDSKATDKTKEQVKNQGQNKDSKALQTKDSKTVDKTKEQTKDSNKDGKKEQDKGSKKDDKKQQNKNSNPAGSEADLVNRMTRLGYTMDWIKRNWPWLTAIGGTGVTSGVVGNKMGKKANVNAEVQRIISNNYVKKADFDMAVQQKVNNDYVKKADFDIAVQQKVQEAVNAHYIKNDDNTVKQKAATLGMIDVNDEDAVKQAASEKYGVKHTDEYLQQRINAAVLTAQNNGLLKRTVDEDKKKPFDDYIKTRDVRLQNSLKLIQGKLEKYFVSILAKTKYGTLDKDSEKTVVKNDKIVNAISMLADLRNALLDKQASKLDAKIVSSSNAEDNAWSRFAFELGSKSYTILLKHTKNEQFYVSEADDEKNEYLILLG